MSEETFPELRLRVQEAMDLHGWSQLDVGNQAGISQGTVSRFLRGGGLSEENADKLNGFLDHLPEPSIPEAPEVRQAIRLYRFIRHLNEEGATLFIREKGGQERALLILW